MKRNIFLIGLFIITLILMGAGGVRYDNLYLNGSTIESIVTNGSLHVKPLGTGGAFIHTTLRIGASTEGDTDLVLDALGKAAITETLKVGSSSSAAAGIEFHLVGDSVMTGQLSAGSSTLPSAGYGIDITGNGFLSGTLSVNKPSLIMSGLEFETLGDGLFSGKLTVNSSTVATDAVEFEVVGDAQLSGSLGIGTSIGSQTTAILELISSTRGFLPPKMMEAQRDAILNPPSGLTIYNLTDDTIDYFDGSSWIPLATTSAASITSSFLNSHIEFAVVNCDASSAIIDEKGSWLDSIGNESGGACAITMTAGVFNDSAPLCLAIERNVSGTPVILAAVASSTTALSVDCADTGGSFCTAYNATIWCVGE